MPAPRNTLTVLITVTSFLGYLDCLRDELRSQQQRINWLLTAPDPFTAALLQSTVDNIERDLQKRYTQLGIVQKQLDNVCIAPPVQKAECKKRKTNCEVCGGPELVKHVQMLCRSLEERKRQLDENRVLFERVKKARTMEVEMIDA